MIHATVDRKNVPGRGSRKRKDLTSGKCLAYLGNRPNAGWGRMGMDEREGVRWERQRGGQAGESPAGHRKEFSFHRVKQGVRSDVTRVSKDHPGFCTENRSWRKIGQKRKQENQTGDHFRVAGAR